MISNAFHVKRSSASTSQLGIRQQLLDLRLLPLVGFCTIFFMATFNLVNFELEDSKVTLDFQLIIKLGVVCLAGAYGLQAFLLNPRVRQTLLSTPGIWLLALSFAYLITAMFGINKVFSVVSSGTILCAILAITAFLVQHGREKALRVLLFSIVLFVVGSWMSYLLVPEYGVFREPLPGGVFLERMGGLSHPNTLGQFCAAGIIIGACYLRCGIGNRALVFAFVVLAAVALYLSLSRTSMLATAAGLSLVFRDKIWSRRWITFGLVGLAFGVTALLVGSALFDLDDQISERATRLLSKSSDSDTDELTTATGRRAIWGKSLSLIQQRPLTGWGAGSSKQLLSEYSQYTHNLFLNIWLSTGIFGGIFITILILVMMFKVVVSPSLVADSLLAFIFVNGLFENVIFSNVASAPTLLFVLAIVWRVIPPTNADELELEYDPA